METAPLFPLFSEDRSNEVPSPIPGTCTYPIAIKGRPKVVLSRLHGFHQVSRIGEVGVRVVASKVLQGDTVDCGIGRRSKLLTEDLLHIGPHDCGEEVGGTVKGAWGWNGRAVEGVTQGDEDMRSEISP